MAKHEAPCGCKVLVEGREMKSWGCEKHDCGSIYMAMTRHLAAEVERLKVRKGCLEDDIRRLHGAIGGDPE